MMYIIRVQIDVLKVFFFDYVINVDYVLRIFNMMVIVFFDCYGLCFK